MTRLPRPLLAFHFLFSAFMLAPLVIVVLVAFTDKGYISMPFDGASLRWFREILNHQDFIDAFYRSVALAAGSATIAAVLALPAGMAIAWHRFTGRDALLGLLLSPLMVPHVVLGIAMLRFLSQIGATGTLAGLVLAHAVVIMPYVLRLVVAAATGFDRSIAQAAESLGASPWTVFARIELPLILPGIAGGWLLAFITSFDELTLTVFLASPSTQTLPVKLYAYITNTIDPLLASISTVMMGLTLVLMLVLERFYGLDRVLGGRS
ncbi:MULTISPECIES: ABC transporter permease [unclassified Mesorhizobium]|uniref:ABC transporter permease n=1 Tax=unclassified Mesorhizobium TaxID=325217 RepID=UPI000FD3CDA9|nr:MULTISPECIES: ABC transporter permease [unclassified Mesorhizobium]RUV97430.1 ABC transporter permease [Mesorhizobium sp. M5C.F.Ca.IN.020.14.1.1]RUV27855.1 ABC transporter permease [Mesorhizobium sp. M5C.F.Ca.IN.020.32.2.1]RWG50746.1 MAG: ABC transporter permease [Mesorhizobium sp.]RWH55718.1 MAG: ABC transporter permease [Mesorhizobium sp.]RWI67755.1 MAG: ABC transporter permease [Mesorhizobium sp.]